MITNTHLPEVAARLRQRAAAMPEFHVVAGFDGFVDEMISVVQERRSLHEFTAVKDMSTFGDLIKAAAGRSGLREIVVHRMDPGGCAVNLGDGLTTLGISLDCFATLGQPRHSAFEPFAAKCRSCHSWGREPGRTLAFEFADGKMMFSATTQLADLSPELLDRVLADGIFAQACAQAQLIAITNWTCYPHMTACWRKLQADVFSKLTQRPWFFIDLVDPSSRKEADIRDMLQALQDFEKSGRVVLGVNGNEANIVARLLGIGPAKENASELQAQAAGIREKLGISQVVTHCVKVAVRADAQGVSAADGPYCANPKKSTGAGDRFNAGYVCGLLLDLPAEQALLLGCASSGFFVREARSATALELADFAEAWSQGRVA